MPSQTESAQQLFPAHAVRRCFAEAAPAQAPCYDIHRWLAEQLIDRLADARRTFERILVLGSNKTLQPLLPKSSNVVYVDLLPVPGGVCANAEHPLPFAPGTFDLVLSNLMLPWINDVPRCLLHAGRALKPDGLLLMNTLGGESFSQLRQSFYQAGSSHPHVMPLVDVQAMGMILQQLKFGLPVVDRDILQLAYPNFHSLFTDLKHSGCTNLHPQRNRGLTGKHMWRRMQQIYRENHALPDGQLALTLEVITLTGWRPHASQQKAKAPGTATVSLAEVLR